MSLNYSSNINNIKPYHNNDTIQQQAPMYSPFIQEQIKPEQFTSQPPQIQPPQIQPFQQPPFQQPPYQQPPYQQPPYQQPQYQQPQYQQPSQTTSYQPIPNNYIIKNDNKVKWIIIIKSIIIFTILFLIISSIKMDTIIYSMIPYLSTNEIGNMVFKGLIFSILIVIIQKILN